MAEFKIPYKGIDKKWGRLRTQLPRVASKKSVSFFKKNFRRQGHLNRGIKKWKQVERRKKGTRAYKYAKPSARRRNILIGRGYLRRSIEPNYSSNRIGTRSKLPYAEVHNQGGRAGRGKGFKMEKRPFMADSEELFEQLENELFNRLDKLMAKL